MGGKKLNVSQINGEWKCGLVLSSTGHGAFVNMVMNV
jgi:hypothetical protein